MLSASNIEYCMDKPSLNNIENTFQTVCTRVNEKGHHPYINKKIPGPWLVNVRPGLTFKARPKAMSFVHTAWKHS